MPLYKSCSVKAFRDNIRMLIGEEGYDREQAVAIAFETLRKACGAPKRARTERWKPERIVRWKRGESVEDIGCSVLREVLDSLEEDEVNLLVKGLNRLYQDKELMQKYDLIEEEQDMKEKDIKEELSEIKPKGAEDSEAFSEEAVLDYREISARLERYFSESIVEALAEYFRDLDFDRITESDLREVMRAVSDVLYRLSRRFPILARRELRMLKARGPEGFIRWFRAQLFK
jgi:hypothetical protein